MPKVSIIVPVYNVENYLIECLDSIINQTLQDIEIICVNDGSTDNSGKILNEYAQKDNRVKVITQENKGAGAARNLGLSIVTGTYLTFLDGDDFYDLKCIEKLYNNAIENNSEIVICAANEYNIKNKSFKRRNDSLVIEYLPQEKVFSYKDISKYIFNFCQNWNWNKLFKTDFIKQHNIHFQELYRTNDLYFTACSLVRAKKITTINETLVNYRVGVKTTSQQTNHLYPYDFYKAFMAVKQDLITLNIYDEVKISFLNRTLRAFVWQIRSLSKNIICNEIRKFIFTTAIYNLEVEELTEENIYDKTIFKKYLSEKKYFAIYQKAIPIVLSSDKNYAKQMYITILSILENKHPDTIYDFKILIPKSFRKLERQFYRLSKKYSNVFLQFIEMGNEFSSNLMTIKHITHTTYYRLKIADLLNNYDKAIYLDTDTIVLNDLSEMYNIDLEDNYIAGVKAAAYIINQNIKYYQSIGIEDLSNYINAGVTIWNIKKIREENLTPVLCNMASKNFKSMDQDIINLVFKGKILHLPLKYNLMTKYNFSNIKDKDYNLWEKIYGKKNILDAINTPTIIHYADKIKPWDKMNVWLAPVWWEYANRSPFKMFYNFGYKLKMLINNIFSIRNIGIHKVITICGIKIKIKSQKLVFRAKIDDLNKNIKEIVKSNNLLCEKYDKQIADLKFELAKLNDKVLVLEDKNSYSAEKFPIRLSDNEKNKIIDNLKLSKSYLEFGSGGSTFLASINSNCEIISVESDNNWIKHIKEWRVLDNVKFKYVNIGKIKAWGYPANEDCKSAWAKYSSEVFSDDIAKEVDLVFVDGRFRVACTLATIMNCSDDVKILIHDFWNRPQYHILLNYLDTIDRVDTLGVFKKKADINYDEISILYKKYCENFE